MKKYVFVYKTTNLLNGKVYIGVHGTNNLNDGYMGSGKVLKQSIKKNGKHNFKTDIIYWAKNYEDAYRVEKKIVNDRFVESSNTYNIHGGGNGCSYVSEETREKMRGRVVSQDTRDKLSEINKGSTHTEETKKKMVEKLLLRPKGKDHPLYGTKRCSEANRKTSDTLVGIKRSDETRRKMSEAKKGRIVSQETRDKLSEINKGKKISQETKDKIKSTKIKNNSWGVGSPCSDKNREHFRRIRTGKKWITKDRINKLINEDELSLYIENGWSRGKYQKQRKEKQNETNG